MVDLTPLESQPVYPSYYLDEILEQSWKKNTFDVKSRLLDREDDWQHPIRISLSYPEKQEQK